MPKVLVVDDARGIRELLKLHLSAAGYAVSLAEDAIVGGRMLLESRPDLMILEAELPYLSGYELAAALAADDETRGIPVVFLSADPEVEQKAKRLGAAAALRKPVSVQRLVQVVNLFVTQPA